MSFEPSPAQIGAPPSMNSPSSQSQALSSVPSSEPPSSSSPSPHASNPFASTDSLTTPTGGGTPDTSAPGTPAGAIRRKPIRRANTAERRATHNAVERQRRETLNSRFLDLAQLLPNLVNVRRPSKSAIINSSIAMVRTQRRLRAIAAREVRQLVREADILRREVNEWRASYPMNPVPTARANSDPSVMDRGAPLQGLREPPRSHELISLIEMEDTSAADDRMNEQERIAYEMRGGDSGPLAASIGEDGEDDYVTGYPTSFDDDGSHFTLPTEHHQPPFQQAAAFTNPIPGVVHAQRSIDGNRARAQSLSVPLQHHQNPSSLRHQPMQMNEPHHSTPFGPHQVLNPHAQNSSQYAQALQQQQMHQHAIQMAQMGMSGGVPSSAPTPGNAFPQNMGPPPSFDAFAQAAAGFPSTLNPPNMPGMPPQHPHMLSEHEAKRAMWNAQLTSNALAQFQQQREQQAQQARHQGFNFPNTPPATSHGPVAAFGGSSPPSVSRRERSEEQEAHHPYIPAESGPSTPGSSHTSSSIPPSLTLSVSGLSSTSSAPPSAGIPETGFPSSLPNSLHTPLHNLSIAAQQQEAFQNINGSNYVYGSAPTAGWGGPNQLPTNNSTPTAEMGANTLNKGNGGGGGMQFVHTPMMNIFI